MLEPSSPRTFLAKTGPRRSGVSLERDEVPILRQVFPIRRQRSKPHLSYPSIANYRASAARRSLGMPRCLIPTCPVSPSNKRRGGPQIQPVISRPQHPLEDTAMDASSSISKEIAPSTVPNPTDDRILVTTNPSDTAQAAPPVPSLPNQAVDLTSGPLGGVINSPATSGMIAPSPAQAAPPVSSLPNQAVDLTSGPLSGIINSPATSGMIAPSPAPAAPPVSSLPNQAVDLTSGPLSGVINSPATSGMIAPSPAQAAPPVSSLPNQAVDLTSGPLGGVINSPTTSGMITPFLIPYSGNSDHAINDVPGSATTVPDCEPSRALSETAPLQGSSQKDATPLPVDRPADHLATAQESSTGTKPQISAASTHHQLDHAGPVSILSTVIMEKQKPDSPPCSVVSKENVTPPLKCMRKAIRNKKEWTTFYKSVSSQCLDLPPKIPHAYERPLSTADIYVHQDQSKGVFQVWVWSGDRWTDAQVDTCHPVLSGYHLKLLPNGDPSWVTRKTMITDQGRAKKALVMND